MHELQNAWLVAAVDALAPNERTILGSARIDEGVVDHLMRIARTSGRAKARQAAIATLLPAARDRLPGVAALAVDLLKDASKFVRYEACRALAVALDRATLPILEKAMDDGVDVPWRGLEGAVRAIKTGSRTSFFDHSTTWVLQDEMWDHKAKATKVVGSVSYGTAIR